MVDKIVLDNEQKPKVVQVSETYVKNVPIDISYQVRQTHMVPEKVPYEHHYLEEEPTVITELTTKEVPVWDKSVVVTETPINYQECTEEWVQKYP